MCTWYGNIGQRHGRLSSGQLKALRGAYAHKTKFLMCRRFLHSHTCSGPFRMYYIHCIRTWGYGHLGSFGLLCLACMHTQRLWHCYPYIVLYCWKIRIMLINIVAQYKNILCYVGSRFKLHALRLFVISCFEYVYLERITGDKKVVCVGGKNSRLIIWTCVQDNC